jgi:hypothetical protein
MTTPSAELTAAIALLNAKILDGTWTDDELREGLCKLRDKRYSIQVKPLKKPRVSKKKVAAVQGSLLEPT